MIKDYFKSHSAGEGNGSAACPAPELLFRWSQNAVSDGERETLVHHAASCRICTEKIAAIESLKSEGFADAPSDEAFVKKLQTEIRRRREPPIAPSDLYRRAWFLAFAVFMALSFVWHEYFMQMLVLAVVCAAKWLIDTRARHIYVDVLHRGETGPSGRGEGRRIEKGPRSLLK